DLQLLQVGDVLPPDRIARCLDQVHHGRRDAELEVVHRLLESREVGEVLRAETLHQMLERAEASFVQELLPVGHSLSPLETKALGINDQVVIRRVKVRYPCRHAVSQRLVERAGRTVIVPRGRFGDDEPPALTRDTLLSDVREPSAYSVPVRK